jgi:DNA-binding LacI/PurR family transcriptional regulator
MPVTIRDVAKHAGVGVGTVSRVLNKSTCVSDGTRQRVLDAIKTLDYRPNPIARRLSLRRTLTISVIAPFFTRPSFVERLRGTEHALAESEYDMILYNVETTERRDECFEAVPRRERTDGMLVIALSPTDEVVNHFLQSGVPTVLIDAHHPSLSRVVIDDVEGGRLATQHLIDLGHRHIGFIGDHFQDLFNSFHCRDRYCGYQDALRRAGIEVRPDYYRQGDHGQQEARLMARDLLSLADRPTAIFAASDTQAMGVIEAANDLGLRVPEDLSVIGYDDIEVASFVHLTTIRQPLYSSGVEGVSLLLETIEDPTPAPRRVLLPLELVERGTTAPPSS